MRRFAILLCLFNAALSAFGQSAASSTPVVRSFLYVDPWLARFELLLPLADALEQAGEARDVMTPLSVEERPALSAKLITASNGWAEIAVNDGAPQQPEASVFMVDSTTAAGTPFPLDGSKPVPLKDAHVALTWTVAMPDKISSIEVRLPRLLKAGELVTLVSFDDTTEELRFTADKPAIRWENNNRLAPPPVWSEVPPVAQRSGPSFATIIAAADVVAGVVLLVLWVRTKRNMLLIGAVACLASALIVPRLPLPLMNGSSPVAVTAEQATAILQPLLENVYLALHEPSADTADVALGPVVTSDLAPKVRQQLGDALRIPKHEALSVRVPRQNVALEVESVDRNEHGFNAQVTWTAVGLIHHLGHPDQRVNKYQAEIVVAPVDGVWKITGLTITQHRQM